MLRGVFRNMQRKPSKTAQQKVQTGDLYLSTASLWEVSILQSLDRIKLNNTIASLVEASKEYLALHILSIEPEHLGVLKSMPFHHRDPFDRLLAAQSLHEKFSIISEDRVFESYGVQRFW